MYPPARVKGKYNPRLGETGLYYWGRKVMETHNFPADNMTDGYWGPDDGPNWPACRVLLTDKIEDLHSEGKFQGYSGMIYWGNEMDSKEIGHDKICGPDNGSPWDDCLREIFYDSDSEY